MKQSQVRDEQLRAISDEGMKQIQHNDMQEEHIRQLREVYGEEAFNQYVQQSQDQETALNDDLAKEKKREQDIYRNGEDGDDQPLAIEYAPNQDV